MKEVIAKLANSLICVSDESFSCDSELPGNVQDAYREFLSWCDGGYTDDHFFHFFGRMGPRQHNLFAWNQTDSWKKYFGLDENVFVFAEDILGTQFSFDLRGNRRVVKMLVPSSGNFTLCANTFEEFIQAEVLNDSTSAHARQIVSDFFAATGATFRPFTHVSTRTPVALGGNDTDLRNLEIANARMNLRILGQINQQIKGLPTGTRIIDVKMDPEKEEIILVPEAQSGLKKIF